MTEHILNFAIALEDDKIIDNIEKNAEKLITDDIKTEVLKRLFTSRYSKAVKKDDYSKKIVVDRYAIFTELANEIVEKCLMDNKDAIIERASDKLCEAMKRTKKFKDAVDEVVS